MSEQIHTKLDNIAKDITDIKVTMAINTEQLAIHIKRTNLLEEQMQVALIPVRYAKVTAWILGVLGTAAALLIAIKQLIIK